MQNQVYIVDDDPGFTKPLTEFISHLDYSVTTLPTLALARQKIKEAVPNILLIDVVLPDGSGMELFNEPTIKNIDQIIVITAHPHINTEVSDAIDNVLIKPIDPDVLKNILTNKETVVTSIERSITLDELKKPFNHMVGRSPQMLRQFEVIEYAAKEDINILIQGETGTGKELAAKTIHRLSGRNRRPLHTFNFGHMPVEDTYADLFGTTDTTKRLKMSARQQGLLEKADGGMIILNHLSSAPELVQGGLIKLLETGKIRPIGATEDIEVDVRVIATSDINFNQLTNYSELEKGLLHRLMEFSITLPPLRERKEDIPLLAQYFLTLLAMQRGNKKKLSDQAMMALIGYEWPGNVREMRNLLQQAFILASGDVISRHLVTERMLTTHTDQNSASTSKADGSESLVMEEAATVRVGETLDAAEEKLIKSTLEATGYDKVATAKILGISLKTLYNRLKLYQNRKRFQ